MSARSAKPVTVTLGALTETAHRHVTSGRYASVSEVVRAGLRALDREEEALERLIKARVERALSDPGPFVSAMDAFAELRAHAETARKT